MAFTYDVTVGTDLAKVRLQIGDTVETGALLTDAEVNFAIDEEPNLVAAAARCAEMVAASFARDFNWEADGTRVAKGDRAKHYSDMAKRLRARSAGGITTLQTRHDDGWQANRGVDHRDTELFIPT